MNPNSFSVAIGVNSTITHNILKGRNAPSYDVLNKIALSFDNINMNWLICEKGETFKTYSDLNTNQALEPGQKYHPIAKPCEKCIMKDELIVSLKREINTLTELNSLLRAR